MIQPQTRLSYGLAIYLLTMNLACQPFDERFSPSDAPPRAQPAPPPNPLNPPAPEDPDALYRQAYQKIKAIKELYAFLECEEAFECAQASFSEYGEGRFKDKAQCLAAYAAQPPIEAQDTAGLKAGRFQYDERAASICFDWYNAIVAQHSCDAPKLEAPLEVSIACNYLIKGVVDIGGDCNSTSECQRHLKCSQWSCGGVCEPYNICGSNGALCEEGTYCQYGQCVPYVMLNGDCAQLQRCEAGTYCKRTSTGSTCVLMHTKAEGEECEDDQECVQGVLCSEDGRCAPWEEPTAAGEGQPCTYFQNECQGGLSCQNIKDNHEGTCAPVLTQGQPCQATHQCEYGLYCTVYVTQQDGIPGQCEPLLPHTAPCKIDYQCLSGYCDSVAQECATRPPECSDNSPL